MIVKAGESYYEFDKNGLTRISTKEKYEQQKLDQVNHPSHYVGKDSTKVYLETIARLEPDISMIDAGAAYASVAISLKRIADSLDWFKQELEKERLPK